MGVIKGLKQEPFDILRLDVGKMINSLVMASASVYMGLGYHEGIDVMNQLYVRRDSINTSFKMMDVDLKFALENVGKSDIVHFVGNTSYNSNDQNKIGWIFKDGILSADKIRTLGAEKRGPSFVFSDAIQYGKPEEWPLRNSFKPEAFSISDAFLHAGAKHYIGTFWMIPDEARLVFAKEFYTFAVDGRPIGEALRAARLKLIEKFGRESLFWAVYKLYGNPDISLFEKEVSLADIAKSSHVPVRPDESFAIPIEKIKKITIWLTLFVTILFTGKAIIALLSPLDILQNPDLSRGVKYIVSHHTDKVPLPAEVLESPESTTDNPVLNQPVQPVQAATPVPKKELPPAVKAKNSDIYSNISVLQEKTYFNILTRSLLKSMANPDGAENGHAVLYKSPDIRFYAKARVYYNRGDFKRSQFFTQKALAIAKNSSDMPLVSALSAFLAYINVESENFKEAIRLVSECGDLCRIAGYQRGIADYYLDIGLLYAMPKNFDEKMSISFLKKALSAYSAINENKYIAKTYLISGCLYLSVDSYLKALNNFGKGSEIALKLNYKKELGLIYKSQGDLFKKYSRYKLADVLLSRALILNTNEHDLLNRIACLDILYSCTFRYLQWNDYEKARGYYERIKTFECDIKNINDARFYNNLSQIAKTLIAKNGNKEGDAGTIYLDIAQDFFRKRSMEYVIGKVRKAVVGKK